MVLSWYLMSLFMNVLARPLTLTKSADSDDQRLDGRSVDMDNNNADAECCGPAGAWWLGKGLPEGVKADVSQDIIGQASDDLSGTTGELDSRTLNDVLGELTTD